MLFSSTYSAFWCWAGFQRFLVKLPNLRSTVACVVCQEILHGIFSATLRRMVSRVFQVFWDVLWWIFKNLCYFVVCQRHLLEQDVFFRNSPNVYHRANDVSTKFFSTMFCKILTIARVLVSQEKLCRLCILMYIQSNVILEDCMPGSFLLFRLNYFPASLFRTDQQNFCSVLVESNLILLLSMLLVRSSHSHYGVRVVLC